MKKTYGFRVMLVFAFIGAVFTGCGEGAGSSAPGDTEALPKAFDPDLYATLWYVSKPIEGGSDTNPGTTLEQPFATVTAALTAIKETYSASDPDWKGKSAGIVILSNMMMAPISVPSGTYPPIVLMGKAPGAADAAKGLTSTSADSLFTVEENISLTLWNITLTGTPAHGDGTGDASLIEVQGGTLVLETGAVITGNVTNNMALDSDGGGVTVKGGTFFMRDGTIRGNTACLGGGVHVKGGTFVMEGGTISGNVGKLVIQDLHGYGGGVFVNGGTFSMKGGSISSNTAARGGGVCLFSGSFSKTGGIIYGSLKREGTPEDRTDAEGNTLKNHGTNMGNAVWLSTKPWAKGCEKTVDEHIFLDSNSYANWDFIGG